MRLNENDKQRTGLKPIFRSYRMRNEVFHKAEGG